MKKIKQLCVFGLAISLAVGQAVPTFAADKSDKSSGKEEVVYTKLDSEGNAKNTYVVNSFPGGDITDYGNYKSVKILNTEDKITQDGNKITFSSDADKVYYQGDLSDTELPWTISIRYYMDGKEYKPDEIAGKSGELKIAFKITKNEKCKGTFYDDYALQASFTLDTEKCRNISASDATVANVGSKKQLTYTILPGEGIDTEITADAKDFEMDAVSINGIQLNLNVDIDDAELKDKVNEIIDATKQLDDGAKDLSSGSEELLGGSGSLKDGASSLKSGVTDLDNGVQTLQSGMGTVQSGLDSLNAQSDKLTSGSAQFKDALETIQTAVNSVSVSSEDLIELVSASGQISQAISDLSDGADKLQANLGYEQYKALMSANGLDIDTLTAGNSQAAASLPDQITALQQMADSLNSAGMTEQAGQISALSAQLQQLSDLLAGDNAAIGGMKSFLDGISAQLPALTDGLTELKTQYEAFDSKINELAGILGNMTGNLSKLADGISQLADSYDSIDTGIDSYTDGVAQLAAGYSQVMDGVSSLASGSKSLLDGSDKLYSGTADLYDGVAQLCDGAKDMSDGTGEFKNETSTMKDQTEEEINNILDSIGGSKGEPKSFVSDKNTDVDSVQFAIQTDAVKVKETKDVQETETKEPTLWEKFTDLFK